MIKLSPKTFLECVFNAKSSIDIRVSGITKIDLKWRVLERSIDEHLLYFVESGQIFGEIDGHSMAFKAHSFIWVQPHVKHQFKPDEKGGNTVVYYARLLIRNEDLVALDQFAYLYVEEFAHLKAHFYEVILNSHEKSVFRDLQLRASVVTLLSDLLKEPQQKNAFKDGLKRHQVYQLVRYMNMNIEKRISSKEMSELLGMNMDYFSRQFKKTFLMSPRAYIMNLRIKKVAAYLSETNMNVSEIAKALQYTDVYQLSHQFKKQYGKSPLQYRKTH